MTEHDTELKRLQEQLAQEAAGHKKAEEEKADLLNNVGLYIKEQNCLYGIAELVRRYDNSLDEVFKNLPSLLTIAWQYPDITCARAVFRGKESKTSDFKATQWMQAADIMVFAEKAGAIEVCYLEERPPLDDGPFLKEEKRLLENVAERLGKIIEHKETREALARAKKDIEESYKKLKELEDLKDSLLHMIIHDLNNPIAAMSGYVELLKMQLSGNLSERQNKSLESALLASRQLKRMVENLLDVNKMEQGNIKLRYEDFSIEDAASGVVEQMTVIAERDNKTLSLEITEKLPEVSADKELIKRVIANLINNAIKFTPPKGSVHVKVLSDRDAGCVCVRVKDTGRGIPKDYLDKIFNKFVRVEAKEAKTGRGLGLTFCKMTIDAHGGKIWVESELEKWSEFIFMLPCNKKG
ncbi:sensor histidine kinase [Candidatus Omnitrophota bacterium]